MKRFFGILSFALLVVAVSISALATGGQLTTRAIQALDALFTPGGVAVVQGWAQNSVGEGALLANYTNATTTFSNTLLSRSLTAGRTYNFDLNLFVSQTIAIDGWKIDFNGGTAAATNFVANCSSTAETGIIVVLANATSAALSTVINATSTVTTGGQSIECHGSMVPSSTGTFVVRGGLNSVTTGTLTIKRGSSIAMRDAPAL